MSLPVELGDPVGIRGGDVFGGEVGVTRDSSFEAIAFQHVLEGFKVAKEIAAMDALRQGATTLDLYRELRAVTPDSLPAPSTFTSLQNLLYAVEWWLFGAFALFLWQRWVRDELERRRAAEEGASGADHPDEPAPAEPDGAGIRSAT